MALRTCVTCFCTVRFTRKCQRCLHELPSFLRADVIDVYECLSCDVAICVMHASEHQMQRQLCHVCYHDTYSEGEEQEPDSEESDDDNRRPVSSWGDSDSDEPWHPQPPPSPPANFNSNARLYRPVEQHVLTPVTGSTHDKCAICLDDMFDKHVVALPCNSTHTFHTHCIDEWLHAGSGSADCCPLCRTRVNILLQPVVTVTT